MNQTILQAFEYNLPDDCSLWRTIAAKSKNLKDAGFTSLWLPPAFKCASGVHDTGYGIYDLYDLGEFDQKGTIPTKYGTKDEYLTAIESLHAEGLQVIADVVLNHRLGADYPEQVSAAASSEANRWERGEDMEITAWTGFNFPGRAGKYSDFKWNHNHFSGVDWDDSAKKRLIFQLGEKDWDENVDLEKGNYDYLLGADVDVNNPEVIAELDRWGAWYLGLTKVDGFRLDAVKHIRFDFFTHWLEKLRKDSGKELWTVGEYWQTDVRALLNYLDKSGGIMNLFDVPLHYNIQEASTSGGAFDMRNIFKGTLVDARPSHAVTFVDNHDTQIGQSLESWVDGWFKSQAYALILLRKDGTPCVFYGDYRGTSAVSSDDNNNEVPKINPVGSPLETLLKLRQSHAYGDQADYFDHENVVGWTRGGDDEHPGLAVLLTNSKGGEKNMCVGVKFAGQTFIDALGNQPNEVVLDSSGQGLFTCADGSISVWIPKGTEK